MDDIAELRGAVAFKNAVRRALAALIERYISFLVGDDCAHNALFSCSWVTLGEEASWRCGNALARRVLGEPRRGGRIGIFLEVLLGRGFLPLQLV